MRITKWSKYHHILNWVLTMTLIVGGFYSSFIPVFAYDNDEESILLQDEDDAEEINDEASDESDIPDFTESKEQLDNEMEDYKSEIEETEDDDPVTDDAEEAEEADEEDTTAEYEEAETPDADIAVDDPEYTDIEDAEDEVREDKTGDIYDWNLDVIYAGLVFDSDDPVQKKQAANNAAISSVDVTDNYDIASISINVDLGDLVSFAGSDAASGEHKWLVLGIYTGTDDILTAARDSVVFENDDVAEAEEYGLAPGYYCLRISAEDLINSSLRIVSGPRFGLQKVITIRVINHGVCNLISEQNGKTSSIYSAAYGLETDPITIFAKDSKGNTISADWEACYSIDPMKSIIDTDDPYGFSASVKDDGKKLIISGIPSKCSTGRIIYVRATGKDNLVSSGEWYKVTIGIKGVELSSEPTALKFYAPVGYTSVSAETIYVSPSKIDPGVKARINVRMSGGQNSKFDISKSDFTYRDDGYAFDMERGDLPFELKISPKGNLAKGVYYESIYVGFSDAVSRSLEISVMLEVVPVETYVLEHAIRTKSVRISTDSFGVPDMLNFGSIAKGGCFDDIDITFFNPGSGECLVSVNEVDSDGVLVSSNRLISIAPSDSGIAAANGTKSFSISPLKEEIGVYSTYMMISCGNKSSIIPVTYAVLNDNVTNVSFYPTPSGDVIILDEGCVEEGYEVYDCRRTLVLKNNSFTKTDQIINVTFSLSGGDTDIFTLDDIGVSNISAGSDMGVCLNISQNLPAGQYTTNLHIKADNIQERTYRIEFNVKPMPVGHFTIDMTGYGHGAYVEDGEDMKGRRLKHFLDAKVGNGVSRNGRDYLVDIDNKSINGNLYDLRFIGDYYGDEYNNDFSVHDICVLPDNSITVSEAKLSLTSEDKSAYRCFGTVELEFTADVGFSAGKGKFTDYVSSVYSSLIYDGYDEKYFYLTVPYYGKLEDAINYKVMPVAVREGYKFYGWIDYYTGEPFDPENTVITKFHPLVANFHEHMYPDSGDSDSENVVWHIGTASKNYVDTWVEVFCVSDDCTYREASKVVVSGDDISISMDDVLLSCEKDGTVTLSVSANASSILRFYTSRIVSTNISPGHDWKYVSDNIIWSSDHNYATTERICQNSIHIGDRSETVSSDEVHIYTTDTDCDAPGTIEYTALWKDGDGKEILRAVDVVSADMLGHDYEAYFSWIDNGFDAQPSVNAVLVCRRNNEHRVDISAASVNICLVTEDRAKATKVWKADFVYDGKYYEDELQVHGTIEHKWEVSFCWGSVSYDIIPSVTASANCLNDGESIRLKVSVSQNETDGVVTWTATVIGFLDDTGIDDEGLNSLVGVSDARYAQMPESKEAEIYGDIWIVGLNDEYEYTGGKITPAFDLIDKDNNRFLARGVDYTVTYGKNTDKDSLGTITVKGKGNYEGKNTGASFRIIDPLNELTNDDIQELRVVKGWTVKVKAQTYTGSEIIPVGIEVKEKGTRNFTTYNYDEKTGAYYDAAGNKLGAVVVFRNNINKGAAGITLLGKDGSIVKKSFKINAVDLRYAGDKLKIDVSDAVYAVKGAAPELAVTSDGRKLIEGQDYKVNYDKKTFKNTGSSIITITGKGNYAKTAAAAYYSIKPLDLNDIDPENVALSYKAGTKAGKIKATVLDNNGNALGNKQIRVSVEGMPDDAVLQPGEDYTVLVSACDDNLVTGSEIRIPIHVGLDISKVYVNVDKYFSKTYTGNCITLDDADFGSGYIDIRTARNGMSLDLGVDFRISGYTNNVKKGTMTVYLTGLGEYSGTKTIKVKIWAKKLADSST